MELYNEPIVIDNGSGTLKAGFAGEDNPKAFGSALVGRPKYQRIMAGSLGDDTKWRTQDEVLVGEAAQSNRGLLRLNYPIEHGIVTNWDDMERLWYHTYTQDLKAVPEEHPVLITEAPYNPRANRDRMCQIFFEQFNVPSVYVSIQATLSLYASGRTTGVVVDIGDGVSHVVPVYEGFSLPSSIKRMDIAGRDITDQLALLVRRSSGVVLQSSSERELARLMKEKCCFVSKDIARDEKLYSPGLLHAGAGTTSELLAEYRLPDGHVIQLGSEQFRAPEILFNPQLLGEETPGIHRLTSLAIAKTDLDLRPTLYQNIILSGGTTLIRNIGERLLNELKDEQQQSATTLWSSKNSTLAYDTKMKVKIFAPPERKYTTWIGGSILAGLSTFKKMWVTAQEYAEDPDIVHRKCM
jgi:centractin